MQKIDTPDALVIPFDPADPRKEGMMKDALRLGEITAKQHLASQKAKAAEDRSLELVEVEAMTGKAGKLVLACIVESVKKSAELAEMLRLINKFGLFKDRGRWTITRLLSTHICVSGFHKNGDPDWFSLASDGLKNGVDGGLHIARRLVTAALPGGKLFTNFAEGDLFMEHGEDTTPGIHFEVKLTAAAISALSKLRNALSAFDAANARVRELEAMEKNLPQTLETIEGTILRERLNSENGGGLAVRAVENAIVAHLSGDVTALLLPTHNLTAPR